MQEEQLVTHYKNIIKQHKNVDFFTKRAERLKKITSIHMFPVEKAQYTDHPVIRHHSTAKVHTLSSLIDGDIELLPTQIKSIAWQITQFMLHCDDLGISHLRLCPQAIVLKQKFSPEKPLFVRVKDFSMGKEFQSVSEGKTLHFFEYLHPDLSIGNRTPQFDTAYPRYDIWSLGTILYKLVYKKSPFCKQGKEVFSKTVLRKYLAEEYEVRFLSNKFASVNQFIARCLALGEASFKNWHELMEWMVHEEQIYNHIDFHNGHFEQMAEMHVRLMALLAGMYCMIVEQCNNSPHPFWHKAVSADVRMPFALKIAEFTLQIMRAQDQRFHRIYGAHVQTLGSSDIKEALTSTSQHLQTELLHKGSQWIQEIFSKKQITLQVLRTIQETCVWVRMEISELDKQLSRRILGREQRNNSFASRKVWKSMQTLHDYCNEVIQLLTDCRNRMKLFYQKFHLSPAFEAILVEDFGYHGIIHVKTGSFIRKIGGRSGQ